MRGLRSACALAACASLPACMLPGSSELPRALPSLTDMEEPPALLAEPGDEAARRALPFGGFTGLYVTDARGSLDALAGEPEGLLVERVVENSPARAAGLEPGDLVLAAGPRGEALAPLSWPSEWRALELAALPGTRLVLRYDRAGVERSCELEVEARLDPAEREAAPRLREEARVGVVLRAPSEVEARAAGLPPGAGAVVVGLARSSPWRSAGLRYEDLVLAVDGVPLAHPELLLQAIRAAPDGGRLALEVLRGTERLRVEARCGARERVWREVHVPLVWRYRREAELRSWSVLLGSVRLERTPAARRLRLLWLFSFERGATERLEELDA